MGKIYLLKKYEGSILQVCTIRDLMSITSNMNKKVIQVFVLNDKYYLVEYMEDR